MAGDWLKIEHTTPDKPEVYSIADRLGMDPEIVFAKLVRFWIWCDKQVLNGNAASVTKNMPDRITGVAGLGAAMAKEGWFQQLEDGFEIPNWEYHLSQGAKKRALTQRRVAKNRQRSGNAASVTKSAPEKRREELIPAGKAGRSAERAKWITEGTEALVADLKTRPECLTRERQLWANLLIDVADLDDRDNLLADIRGICREVTKTYAAEDMKNYRAIAFTRAKGLLNGH